MKRFILKHWACVCGYYQDFAPTPEAMFRSFGRFDSTCPSCKQNNLEESVTPKVFMNTIDKDNPEEMKEIKRDQDGKVITLDGANPEMRSLNTKETADKKAKIDADIAVVADQIVEEVTK